MIAIIQHDINTLNKIHSDQAELFKTISEILRRQQTENITNIPRDENDTDDSYSFRSALNISDPIFNECLDSTDNSTDIDGCVVRSIFNECLDSTDNSTDIGRCVLKRFGPNAYKDPLLLKIFSRLEKNLEGQERVLQRKFKLSAILQPGFLDMIESDRKQLLQNRTLLQNEKNEIADRLNQIQFPFTTLPIKLDDAIMVFPISLAVGFLVCINLLCNAIHLRKNFHSAYLKKNPMQMKLKDKEEIALITPLWIDPLNSKLNQMIRFTILLTPFAIFILVWYLIIYYLIASESDTSISLSLESTYNWISYHQIRRTT